MIHRSLRVMLAISITFVVLTVAAFLFMLDMMQSGSGVGTIGSMLLMIVSIPALVCVMTTLGFWIYQRNRSVTEGVHIVDPKSDK